MVDITNPIFHDEAKALAHLEASRWPQGPYCPFCGSFNAHRMAGKTQAGMFLCNDCRTKFTARVGSIMERSHIPVHKWLMAMHLMAASKKGMSSKQLQRMLGVSYKSAWFLSMRIREAMRAEGVEPIGGEGKVIESDETFVGGKKKNVHRGKPEPKKHAVHALVERGGRMRAKHVADVTAKTLKKNLKELADDKSALHTDDSLANISIGRDFADHKTVATRWASTSRGTLTPRQSSPSSRCSSAASSAHSIRSANSICSATLMSSHSAGTTARHLGSRTQSAPPNCSRPSLASA
jgi:transposase-like protein